MENTKIEFSAAHTFLQFQTFLYLFYNVNAEEDIPNVP